MNSESMIAWKFVAAHPIDAGRTLERLEAEESALFLESCTPESGARLLKSMNPGIGADCLASMSVSSAAALVGRLPVEVAAMLLRRCLETQRVVILNALPRNLIDPISLILQYPENTAGALMDPLAFTLNHDLAVREALLLIRKNAENVYYHVPVVDRSQRFLGLANMRDVMLASPDTPVSQVILQGVGRLSPMTGREAIISHQDWQIYHDLPVVDESGVFLGLIGYQVVRRLESELAVEGRPVPGSDAGAALGELYWLGMSALFKGAATVLKPGDPSPSGNKGSEKKK